MHRLMILAAFVASFVVASAASASANQTASARSEVAARKGPIAKLIELERRKTDWLRSLFGRCATKQKPALGAGKPRRADRDPASACRGFRRPCLALSLANQQMNAVTVAWLDSLREHSVATRIAMPLTGEHRSAAETAAERMILAAWFSLWLTGFDDVLAARRTWLEEPNLAADRDPAIIVTTSPVGIAVAEELIGTGNLPARSLAGKLIAVTEREYRLWCIAHPDEKYLHHVNVWNWIKTKVPDQRHAEFARHPLRSGEDYWLHRAGFAGVGAADRRDCHLWKWNGRQAALLEAFVTERNVGRLGHATAD